MFKIDDSNGSRVTSFIPIKEIIEEMQFIDDLPKGAYPIAWDECGNYVIVNEADAGGVFFWDHEGIVGMVKLANNFNLFLNMLEPFDVNSIEMEAERVLEVWVDPDFLKKLKADMFCCI